MLAPSGSQFRPVDDAASAALATANEMIAAQQAQIGVLKELVAHLCRCASCGQQTRAAFPEGIGAPVQFPGRDRVPDWRQDAMAACRVHIAADILPHLEFPASEPPAARAILVGPRQRGKVFASFFKKKALFLFFFEKKNQKTFIR